MSRVKENSKKTSRLIAPADLKSDELEINKDGSGINILEEKTSDDSLIENVDVDSETDENEMDDEEIDPFNDKWEM